MITTKTISGEKASTTNWSNRYYDLVTLPLKDDKVLHVMSPQNRKSAPFTEAQIVLIWISKISLIWILC